MFQVMPCCSRPSMCGTLICMRVHSGMASVWVQVVASRRSHHHPLPVTLSLHLVTSLPLPSWARDFPSEKSLLSRSHSTFHITLSRHALLSSQITARQSGRSAAHPAPLKGTGEKSANPLCSPPPLPLSERLYVVWWFVVYIVNLHRLCLTNSINQLSEKSIGCIMAHISQWFIFAFLSFSLQTHTHTNDPLHLDFDFSITWAQCLFTAMTLKMFKLLK